MKSESLRLSGLAPADFVSWALTRAEFAAAIKAGPGMVALVGPDGSGKTYTLTAFALALDQQGARLRNAGQPVQAGVLIDLVDGIDAEGSGRLDAEPPFAGLRAVAIRPELLAPLLLAHPGMRVVRVGRMSSPDIRAMLATRRKQLGLSPDALTFKAMLNFDRLCEGNPRKLDRLFGRAERAARGAHSSRILGEHVMQADRDIAAEQRDEVAGRRSLPDDLAMVAEVETPVRLAADGWIEACPVPLVPEVLHARPDGAGVDGVVEEQRMPGSGRSEQLAAAVSVGWAEVSDPACDVQSLDVRSKPEQEARSAHAAMWARLATPSSPAELAAAAAASGEPARNRVMLVRVCAALVVVVILLPPSYHGHIWRVASGVATAVKHYGLTIAETQPLPRVAASRIPAGRLGPVDASASDRTAALR